MHRKYARISMHRILINLDFRMHSMSMNGQKMQSQSTSSFQVTYVATFSDLKLVQHVGDIEKLENLF